MGERDAQRKTVKYKFKLTAVALANKVACIVFVLMTRDGQYDDQPVRGLTTATGRAVRWPASRRDRSPQQRFL